jgi:predicted permease
MSELGEGVVEMALFYTLLMVLVLIFFLICSRLFRGKKQEDVVTKTIAHARR